MINNAAYREWSIEHEYEISRSCLHLAVRCPHVTWNEAQKLYQLAIEKAKIILKVKHIIDAPFGRGLVTVRNIFTEDMTALERFRVEENKPHEDKEEERVDWLDDV